VRLLGRKASAPFTAYGGSFGFHRTRTPGLLPAAPSRASDPARPQKVPDVVHSLATTCGQKKSVLGGQGSPLWPRWNGQGFPVQATGSRLVGERHLGYADPGLLRGGSGDAALGGAVEGAALNRRFLAALDSPSSEATASTTRGVRADRVGEKRSSRSPTRRYGGEATLDKRGAPGP